MWNTLVIKTKIAVFVKAAESETASNSLYSKYIEKKCDGKGLLYNLHNFIASILTSMKTIISDKKGNKLNAGVNITT